MGLQFKKPFINNLNIPDNYLPVFPDNRKGMGKSFYSQAIAVLLSIIALLSCSNPESYNRDINSRIDSLLSIMTLDEKIGQTFQISGGGEETEALLRDGKLGSLINVTDARELNRIQQIAINESRLGIPLLIGRDVIHGFKTILPVPLGQAASWNGELIRAGAAVAASEARSVGIHWTFAPMLDVSRDARWGRIAESLGEDTYLTQVLGMEMIKGFQGDTLADASTLAACAKHFAAYGAAEGGRDYNSVDISMETLHNVYLPPFKSAVDAGAASFMVSFNEINGIPSSGNETLVRGILKDHWKFKGPVVSDWASVTEMISHGYVKDAEHAAEVAIKAGVDMEMQTTAYFEHLRELITTGMVSENLLDDAVRRILGMKYKLGLFEHPYVSEEVNFDTLTKVNMDIALQLATESLVLLKNSDQVLPLSADIHRIAILGPMANSAYEQLGTWVFDAEERHTITPYMAIAKKLGKGRIVFDEVLAYSRDRDNSGFDQAIRAANASDLVLLFTGEESILSGEAHCRADIRLPGIQEELVKAVKKTGKPLVLIVMAGRPIAMKAIEPFCDAILFAWHPGTMGGPAIADVIFGESVPSGKLPVSFPSMSGQEPLYYNHKMTGRPANRDTFIPMDEIPVRAFQTSLGNTAHYIDAGFEPMYPFGFGLSYTQFAYSDLQLSQDTINMHDVLQVSVRVKNSGNYDAKETVQLYIRDLVGSITRPVKELKAFKKTELRAGEEQLVTFTITAADLAFWHNGDWLAEPGEFELYTGSSSNSADCLSAKFLLGL
jgi:beta-glucosidase